MLRASSRRAIRSAIILATMWPLLPSGPAGEVAPLTLYQRCGRSPWVIIGDILDGDDRFAEVKVVEVLKGDYAGERLRVVHRLENFLRKSWEGKIALATSDRAILFLQRYDPELTEGSKVPAKLQSEDMFASTFGAEGVFAMPAEGQEAYVEAVRTFSRVTSIQDAAEQEERILEFLISPNPHILQAGLEQVRNLRIAGDEQVPVLLRLADSSREPVRLNALQVLGQVAEDLGDAGRTLPDQQDVVNRLKGKVIGTESDLFRAEAVKVVALLGGPAERSFLERVSREDPSQLVRYEASRALTGVGD